MIYVDTAFMYTFSTQQLRALPTDTKVEAWRALHGSGVPSEEERFTSLGPQEQAEYLFRLMHPGEEELVTKDRLANYIELLEHLSTTKGNLRSMLRNIKDYPGLSAEELVRLLGTAREMDMAMAEFHNAVANACFV